MALVASNEENVACHGPLFCISGLDCCFLNFMFIKLSPLSSTFLLIVAIRGFAAVARAVVSLFSLVTKCKALWNHA